MLAASPEVIVRLLHDLAADAGSGADATARTAADAAVQQIQNDVHAAQALLSVATLPSIDLHIKQLSLIIMKRAIEVHYSADSTMFQQPVIPTAEKHALKCALITVLSTGGQGIIDGTPASRKVQTALATVVAAIARYDAPHDWPALFPTLINRLSMAPPCVFALNTLQLVVSDVIGPDNACDMAAHVLPPLKMLFDGGSLAEDKPSAVFVLQTAQCLINASVAVFDLAGKEVKRILASLYPWWVQLADAVIAECQTHIRLTHCANCAIEACRILSALVPLYQNKKLRATGGAACSTVIQKIPSLLQDTISVYNDFAEERIFDSFGNEEGPRVVVSSAVEAVSSVFNVRTKSFLAPFLRGTVQAVVPYLSHHGVENTGWEQLGLLSEEPWLDVGVPMAAADLVCDILKFASEVDVMGLLSFINESVTSCKSLDEATDDTKWLRYESILLLLLILMQEHDAVELVLDAGGSAESILSVCFAPDGAPATVISASMQCAAVLGQRAQAVCPNIVTALCSSMRNAWDGLENAECLRCVSAVCCTKCLESLGSSGSSLSIPVSEVVGLVLDVLIKSLYGVGESWSSELETSLLVVLEALESVLSRGGCPGYDKALADVFLFALGGPWRGDAALAAAVVSAAAPAAAFSEDVEVVLVRSAGDEVQSVMSSLASAQASAHVTELCSRVDTAMGLIAEVLGCASEKTAVPTSRTASSRIFSFLPAVLRLSQDVAAHASLFDDACVQAASVCVAACIRRGGIALMSEDGVGQMVIQFLHLLLNGQLSDSAILFCGGVVDAICSRLTDDSQVTQLVTTLLPAAIRRLSACQQDNSKTALTLMSVRLILGCTSEPAVISAYQLIVDGGPEGSAAWTNFLNCICHSIRDSLGHLQKKRLLVCLGLLCGCTSSGSVPVDSVFAPARGRTRSQTQGAGSWSQAPAVNVLFSLCVEAVLASDRDRRDDADAGSEDSDEDWDDADESGDDADEGGGVFAAADDFEEYMKRMGGGDESDDEEMYNADDRADQYFAISEVSIAANELQRIAKTNTASFAICYNALSTDTRESVKLALQSVPS